MLCYFCDDPRPARRRVGQVDAAVGVFDYGGGDGGEGAFEWFDEICFGGDVAECVCGVGDAEVYLVTRLALKLGDGERSVPFISLFIITPVSGTIS